MNEKELRGKVEQLLLAEKIRQLREKGYEQEVRAFVLDAKEKQLEYEYRYNHYHDPQNGRFTSGGGGGGSTFNGNEMGAALYFGYRDNKKKFQRDFAEYGYAAYAARQMTSYQLKEHINNIEKKHYSGFYDENGKMGKLTYKDYDYLKSALKIRERIEHEDAQHWDAKKEQKKKQQMQKNANKEYKAQIKAGQQSFF
jgi:hypothetical protein